MRAYLDERGVPVPQNGKIDELRAAVRYNAHKPKVRPGFTDSAFDSWSTEQLRGFLGKNAKGAREDLIASAKKRYASASSKGGDAWSLLTVQGAKTTGYLFDQWSDSDLMSFLDSYGISVRQGSKRDEVLAAAKRNSRYFTQGPDRYSNGIVAPLQYYANRGIDYIKNFIAGTLESTYNAGQKVGHAAKEQGMTGKHRAQEATKKAGDRVYEKGQKVHDKVKNEL